MNGNIFQQLSNTVTVFCKIFVCKNETAETVTVERLYCEKSKEKRTHFR